MAHTPLLPYKNEFLLELANNNYSQKTVMNYGRDLGFFEAFLWNRSLPFMEVNKLAISSYKGFLQSGEHVGALTDLENHIQLELEEYRLNQMGLPANTKPEKVHSQAESNVGQVNTEESSSKGAKINFKKKKGLAPRSINRLLSSLRNYLKFLIEIDEKVPLAPDAVKLIKTERKESQVAEIDELIRLIEAPETFETNPIVRARNRAMLELLFATGMRISELINLNREHLKFYKSNEEDITGIAGKMYIQGKGKKSRFVYLTGRSKKWLKRYLDKRNDSYPALFIPYRGGRAGTKDPETVRISINYFQDKIVKYRRELGIIVPTSAHSLRHGFATYLAENGANAAAIQRLLGHESLQTTTRYVHASDRFAEKTHREFHPAQD